MIMFKQDDQIWLGGKGHTVHDNFDGTSRANRMAELDEVRIALCYSCLIKSRLKYIIEGVNNNGENIEVGLCSFYLQCRR
jgi:hypothetical protein